MGTPYRGREHQDMMPEPRSPEAKGQRKFLVGKSRQNPSGRGASKNSGFKDPEREAEELSASL